MKTWIAKGLLWGLGGYFLTIILIPVMSGNGLTPFKLGFGAALWFITGMSIGNLFYNKPVKGKTARAKRKKRK